MAQAKLLDMKMVLRCRDFEATNRFYTEILQLEAVESWDEAGGKAASLPLERMAHSDILKNMI